MSHYIANQWQTGQGTSFQSIAPFENESIWEGKAAIDSEVNAAVQAAFDAFESWADTSFDDRLAYVLRYKSELEANKDHLAKVIAQETGKPLWEAEQEAGAMIGKVQLSFDASNERLAEQQLPVGDATGITRYKPHGVCAVFGPFNLPGHLPNGHIIPALLVGNTIIFKPSEKTPLIGQEMIKCWERAQLPVGVLNLIQGAAETGKALATHPQVNGIFFTGSYNVGRAINQMLADHPEKIIALEMGGNNPLVVHDTADIAAAVYQTILSGYITAGQRCTCARRLIVPQTPQGDIFVEQLLEQLAKIQIGAWDQDPAPFYGTVIDIQAAKNLLVAQQQLIDMGAKPLLAMTQPDETKPLLTPGLLDVTEIQDLPDSEMFGPVMQLIRVPDFDAAITTSNATSFGLSAALLCDDEELYNRFYRKIRAGIVNWNRQTTGASGRLPFGGCGCSGNNRPAGFYSSDYCAFPVASLEAKSLVFPEKTLPGTGY